MKKLHFILIIICFFWGGFFVGKKYGLITNNEGNLLEVENEKALELYNQFLEGKRNVYPQGYESGKGISIIDITVPTGQPDKVYATKYTFFDSNRDGILDLHVRSARTYIILTYKKNNLDVWSSPDRLCDLQNNGAYLYSHMGGGPSHEGYYYCMLDFYGEEVFRIYFSRTDENSDDQYNEDDGYYFEDVKVTYDEWTKLTKPYLTVGNDKIEWIVLYEETT